MTPDEQRVILRALGSILDVLEELCVGLAHGQTPEPEWAAIVETSFNEHRQELATGMVIA